MMRNINNETMAIFAKIFKRDNKTCQYCGGYGDSIDHIIPFTLGGSELEENLVACCSRCNSLAGNKSFKSFGRKKSYILNQRKIKKLKSLTELEFKYERICKLPLCKKEFKTNREWQEFCHPEHQKEYQRLLRRSHEETIVEVELLKIRIRKIEEKIK